MSASTSRALRHSPEAAYAKRVFYSRKLVIFVEDVSEGTKKAYLNLFRMLLDGAAFEVGMVESLDGKRNVLAYAEKYKEKPEGAVCAFIVDGDYDCLTGAPLGACDDNCYLYRLPCYCIENLLFDGSEARCRVAEEEGGYADDSSILAWWNELESSLETALVPLFIDFSIANDFGVKTITRGINAVAERDSRNLYKVQAPLVASTRDAVVAEVADAINHMKQPEQVDEVGEKRALQSRDVDTYMSLRRQRATESLERLGHPLCAVSGKDYLMPLLRDELDRRMPRMRFRCDDQTKFNNRFATHPNVKHCEGLKRFLMQLGSRVSIANTDGETDCDGATSHADS